MSVTSPLPGRVVIDASLAVWALLPVLAKVDGVALLEVWRRNGMRLVAPALWIAECVSAIRYSVYTRSISHEEARLVLGDLFGLGVEALPTTQQQCQAALDWAARLKQARAYDGLYLALAEELGVEFWTADGRLANAAQEAGVSWVHTVR